VKYLIFLRGINVGGLKVSMAELKLALEQTNLDKVRTYLNSGNATFFSNRNEKELKAELIKNLKDKLNYSDHLFIYSESQIKSVVNGFPFKSSQLKHSYVILCQSDKVASDLARAAKDLTHINEEVIPAKDVVYWSVTKGDTTTSVFSKLLTKKEFKFCLTNRNLNTLQKMLSSS